MLFLKRVSLGTNSIGNSFAMLLSFVSSRGSVLSSHHPIWRQILRTTTFSMYHGTTVTTVVVTRGQGVAVTASIRENNYHLFEKNVNEQSILSKPLAFAVSPKGVIHCSIKRC